MITGGHRDAVYDTTSCEVKEARRSENPQASGPRIGRIYGGSQRGNRTRMVPDWRLERTQRRVTFLGFDAAVNDVILDRDIIEGEAKSDLIFF